MNIMGQPSLTPRGGQGALRFQRLFLLCFSLLMGLSPAMLLSSESVTPLQDNRSHRPSLNGFLRRCQKVSKEKLQYRFGGTQAKSGVDCSGIVWSLLKAEGLQEVPRTSERQFLWLKAHETLFPIYPQDDLQSLTKRLRPGDLIFWKDTFNNDRQTGVTHVMVYMGLSAQDEPLVFGASPNRRGKNEAEVDIHPLTWPSPQSKASLVGYGRIPGLAVN